MHTDHWGSFQTVDADSGLGGGQRFCISNELVGILDAPYSKTIKKSGPEQLIKTEQWLILLPARNG